MTASDIFDYAAKYISACGPVFIVVALIPIAGKLIDLITGIFDRGD